MANDTTVVKGLDALNKALQELPVKIERNALRGAMRAGAKEFLTLARAKAPVDDGDLRRSIKIRTSARGGQVKATVVAGDEVAWYSHLVEFGTKKHIISMAAKDRPTRMTRRGLRAYSIRTINRMIDRGSLVIGGAFVGPKVEHPGAKPHPFMRPALDAGQRPALDAFAAYLRKRIDKEQLKGPDT
jgi:HK97 gp10 family phage protein